MQYKELLNRYGTHVSQRVRMELTENEFSSVLIDNLEHWLELRAKRAHADYRQLLNNPLAASETDIARAGYACCKWREAEDLAYLVAVSSDTVIHAHAV